jgi:Holliday junction resolvasome RuvABC ATP-dependent DNA helicase subunit
VITGPVEALVTDVALQLAALSGRDPSGHRAEAVQEAAALVAAVIDSDERHSAAELETYHDTLGPLLDPPLSVSSERLRGSDLIAGRRAWLLRPSVLADLLLRADARDGGRRSHVYYDRALALAHAVAAIDLVTSPGEIDAIDAFRRVLLTAMDDYGVPRPGRAVPQEPMPPDEPTRPTSAPDQGPEPLESLLAELDELVGLQVVKDEVHRLTSLIRVQRLRAERGLPTVDASHHLVFTGNPGTGKTTVARLLARVFRSLGVLSQGHLVETDRSHLVAGYIGQTATRTRQVLETAVGGMLLIDEAYALARGGEQDFGREAIDTLVKFMEDHRDDLAVVVAGYPAEMETLIDTNPGLRSRFTRTLHFDDYADDELIEIFRRMGDKAQYRPDDGAIERLRMILLATPRGPGFGNARFVRNTFEAAVARHAQRVAQMQAPTDEDLTTLTADDVGAG